MLTFVILFRVNYIQHTSDSRLSFLNKSSLSNLSLWSGTTLGMLIAKSLETWLHNVLSITGSMITMSTFIHAHKPQQFSHSMRVRVYFAVLWLAHGNRIFSLFTKYGKNRTNPWWLILVEFMIHIISNKTGKYRTTPYKGYCFLLLTLYILLFVFCKIWTAPI